ncbi:TGF-beta domain-containing family member maverick isoform X2 [Lycorma delicatula]|uniref:TGF-beta domain-containing family member maverick isoform X2 n=1 Tax=Lycorma delicatula TaxID=130591 RepID=UPI003F511F83
MMLQMNVSQEEFGRMFGVYMERQSGVNLHTITPTADEMVDRRLRFSLEKVKDSEVQQATLRILVEGGTRIGVRILGSTRFVPSSLISRKVGPSKFPKWTELDLTDAVRTRLTEGSNHIGVELTCRRCLYPRDIASSSGPNLNIITRENTGLRKKRSSRTDCYKDNHRKRCCRHTMDVVFKDLPGFEFIIQPYSFDAGYCKGRCPARYNPAHHHALLQSLIWKQDRQRAPRPCCAPSKLADLEILHLDEDDPTVLKVSTWKNMRVLECACS